jgi:TRAP-type C4-dicarboxylate transport system substrate-binding protein
MLKKIARVASLGVIAGFMSVTASEAADLTFHGASQFDESHPFTRMMRKFEELTALYNTSGKSLSFVMHLNSELGLEKDYFNYMNQGISVDYAVVSPAHMSTFSKLATLYDPPFLFRNTMHWAQVLSSNVLKPIEDDILKRADVIILGYGGGGVRNLIVNKPVTNMAEIKGLPVRVQGAPIWTTTFAAAGMAPTVIAYGEVYNAIQTGRIAAAENEAAGLQQMKFYEVGPNIAMTQHAITIRPLVFSNKTFVKLPKTLQEAIIQAGRDAGTYGRILESSEDSQLMLQMQKEGKLKMVPFTERDKLVAATAPIVEKYFTEVGGADIFKAIQAVK